MSMDVQEVLENALALSTADRTVLIEQLMASLHVLDPDIDELWVKEAKDRLAAYEAERMSAIPVEQVFQELET